MSYKLMIDNTEYDLFELKDQDNETLEKLMIEVSDLVENDWNNYSKQNTYRLFVCDLERIILNDRNGFIFRELMSDKVTHVTFMDQEKR